MLKTSTHRNPDARMAQAINWLEQVGIEAAGMQPVTGDASARRYFRIDIANPPLLLMDSPPDSEPLHGFIDVTQRLRSAGLPAPEIHEHSEALGFALLEDFGDCQLRSELTRDTVTLWWLPVFDLLTRMAHNTRAEGLPGYSAQLLQQELDLFPDWYLAKHLDKRLSAQQRQVWTELCEQLIASAQQQPQVFVHRDFHSCNLMVCNDGALGLIDYQDAVEGPVSYDLMSILLDRYISWPRDLLEGWMRVMRRQLAPQIEPSDWMRYCDWMGLQRNLKIIGIFARLNYRDNKADYLALIPRFADYVLDASSRYPELESAHLLLEDILCAP